ncbi:PBSX family phage terminase large subunit [Paenarthrobacter sp. A20]|uniref:PBSX family phage terminase large subunit n=1 Tax=Paenarthrobacter sp. A20 TaxID=2817891 RepID=UPI00209D9C33|nr:PBSX family phage terminase large subunit [Paenarthrobacter sp. A20]MCP1414394.1 PBSX family phage terminase large subunit [Paenarthrobacter sp. A20]
MEAKPLQGKALLCLQHPSASIEAYEGAVRSGKTFTSLLDWVRFVRQGPEGQLAMCGRTERTIINNLLLPLQEMLGKNRVKINYGTGTATIVGREVHIYGANNEQARTKIQGLTLAGAYLDEAETIPESFFKMLYTRLSVPGAKLWLTSNPGGPAHWLKIDWLDKARLWIDGAGKIHRNPSSDALELHRFTFLMDDNQSLTPEYIARQKKSYTGLFYRRYILAEWVAADGAVFDSWDPERHVVKHEDLPEMRSVLALGVDYGTTNATSAVMLGLGIDGVLYAMDEWRHDSRKAIVRLTDGQLSAALKDWVAGQSRHGAVPEWVIVDPAAASFKVQLSADGMDNVINGDNNVLYGIRTLSSLLNAGKLRISDRCTGLISEMPGYSWDTKATEKGEDKPMKVADHSIDAFRYAVATTETNWRDWVDLAA